MLTTVCLRDHYTDSADVEKSVAMQQNAVGADFPYAVDPDDHCETPAEAFRDICGLLSQLGTPGNLRVYDPYFCDGAVIKHLMSIGFPKVYNKKEDCYQRWSARNDWMSQFDVLVTNPPYSGNQIEKLMQFVTSQQKFGHRPWFLLMPQWVHKKSYFQELTKNIQPFYLVPNKRYIYLPPTDFRAAKKSDVHKKSSPFVSMWYCWGGTRDRNEQLIRYFQRHHGNAQSCVLARSKSALRDLRRRDREH